MSEPYVGEIRLLPYLRGAPIDWQLCDGSLLQISQFDLLYALIGTTYGGDGVQTFAVPDLRGRVPIHQGQGTALSPYQLGQTGGTEQVTLTIQTMASHFHVLVAGTGPGSQASPANAITATVAGEPLYADVTAGATPYALPASTCGFAGGNQGHENCAPTLALNYCIALNGIYPQQQ